MSGILKWKDIVQPIDEIQATNILKNGLEVATLEDIASAGEAQFTAWLNGNNLAAGNGSSAIPNYSIAIGPSAQVISGYQYGIAIGSVAYCAGRSSVALGNSSRVETSDILDIDNYGVISVGSAVPNSPIVNRRIIRVRDGVNDTDAATLGQVKNLISNNIISAKITNQNLSTEGATGQLSYDGLTIQATNDSGTFLYLTLFSETSITADVIRTVFTTSGTSTQRNDNVTIDSTGLQLTPLTQGATVKAQIEIIVSDGRIYNGWLGSNLDLSRCWGYVEKI